MKNFKDKVAVITGAGSGMGQELALQLASEGCNIALVEWKEELLNENRCTILEKFFVIDRKHGHQYPPRFSYFSFLCFLKLYLQRS